MDLKITENGNGGELVFNGVDLELTSEIYNQPYLARFGGNVQNSTTDQFNENDIRGDFWGNSLLLESAENEQFNSKFEHTINQTELSSSGRITLEQAAKDDLKYLESFSDSQTTVKITNVDKIQLIDQVTQGENQNFSYIWSEAKDEVLTND